MYRYDTNWRLGMAQTIARAVAETPLLAYAQDLHWQSVGRLTGCPATRQRDAEGREVYASVFFVDLDTSSARGLSLFGPDDEVPVHGELGRYGPSILDGRHRLGSADGPGIDIRMSFTLVALGGGPDDLRISTPVNAAIDRIPVLEQEPDSYRIARAARATGTLCDVPPTATALWPSPTTCRYAINPDRDINGVGLLYFANYVAFLDTAERDALRAVPGLAMHHAGRRVTCRRRIAYYGNARSSDQLEVATEAAALDGPAARHLLVRQRIHRLSDNRLIALACAERRLVPEPS